MHQLFTAVILLAGTVLSAGSILKEPRNIDLSGGVIRVRPAGQVVFQENFNSQLAGWKPMTNYAGRLRVTFEEFEGQSCMMLRYAGDGAADTAWGTASPVFSVPKAERFALTILSSSSSDTSASSGKGNYQNRIEWYGPKGRIGSVPFQFRSLNGKYFSSRITGNIPPGTIQARIYLGYDLPNIPKNGYQALAELTFAVLGKEDIYGEDASFESRIFPAEKGEVSLEALCPAGTGIRVQLSCAPDDRGKPGKWGPWFGPDGKSGSFFQGQKGERIPPLPPEMRWMKYRATLLPARKSPVLSAVAVGSFRDGKWTDFYDLQPPFAENTSRHGRLSVRIHDSSPVHWGGLRFSVDGRDVTEKAVFRENEVSYTLPENMSPGLHSFSVSAEDLEGNGNSEVIRYFYTGEPLSGKKGFSIRQDGMVLHGGKMLFPLILLPPSPGKISGKWADSGINTWFQISGKAGSSPAGELKSSAENHLFFLASGLNSGSREVLLQWAMNAEKNADGPALLGWHLAENRPNAFDRDTVAETADLVKAVAPCRLTVQTVPSKLFSRFGGCTDVFLLDPLPGTTPAVLAEELRSVREKLLEEFFLPRSLWVRIRLKNLLGERHEREKMLRCLSWLSVIRGAAGIVWDCSGLGEDDPVLPALKQLSCEIRMLVSCFAEKEASFVRPRSADGSGEAVFLFCTLRNREGKSYLFAVNPAGEQVKASFYLPGLTSGEVCFSGRPAPVEKNVLTDTFDPFDVRVYELK